MPRCEPRAREPTAVRVRGGPCALALPLPCGAPRRAALRGWRWRGGTPPQAQRGGSPRGGPRGSGARRARRGPPRWRGNSKVHKCGPVVNRHNFTHITVIFHNDSCDVTSA